MTHQLLERPLKQRDKVESRDIQFLHHLHLRRRHHHRPYEAFLVYGGDGTCSRDALSYAELEDV